MEIALKPVETLLFSSDVVALGIFRCPATHPLYRDSGPCSHHTIAFPHTSTVIRHEEGATFVGTPACASLYNQHQLYRRTKIDDIDASDWIVLSDDVLLAVMAAFDRSAEGRSAKPFVHAHAAVDASVYVEQRRLFETAVDGDVLAVEEAAIGICTRVISSAYGARAAISRSRDRVETVKRLVAAAPERNQSLRRLAEAVETSPFQLCRSFRRLTGISIGAYRHSLRLRRALDLLRERRRDLTDLALDLGYSSHSHFTAAFRRHFGITPTQFRDSGAPPAGLRFKHDDSSFSGNGHPHGAGMV